MTDAAPAPQTADPVEKPVPKQRPKMTLEEQSRFLLDIRQRCTMATGANAGLVAGSTHLYLTEQDVMVLETIQQSLAALALHRADLLVRDKIARDRRAGFRGGSR